MDLVGLVSVEDATALSDAALDRALVDLEAARRTLEASYLAVVDRADRTGRYRHDGHATVRGWMTALADTSSVETQRRLQSMRALRDLPELGAALAAGWVGVDHVLRSPNCMRTNESGRWWSTATCASSPTLGRCS